MTLAKVCVTLATLALAPGLGRADDGEEEYPISASDTIRDGVLADLDGAAGPVIFGQVLLDNVPTALEVRRAGPQSRARPRPTLVVSNSGSTSARVSLDVQFEDDAGTVLLSCAFYTNVKPGWNELVDKICVHEDMPLLAWPKVQVIRVAGKVRARPGRTP